jgi:TDG/mug DNA glycosylase family protein
MPGRRSLEMHQYYAHPQNHFWRIMGELCGAGLELPYQNRLTALQQAGIALWDVLQACDRAGSLDGNIRKESEIANDLPALLADFSSIQAIGFNGGKARLAFHQLVIPNLASSIIDKITLYPLPSTSPANARMSFEGKLKEWQVLKQHFLR